jgi:hypothetical protein
VFLTWEWVSTWWRIYGADDQLYVLVVRSEERTIIGLAPLRRIPGSFGADSIAFIGAGSDVIPEYLDFIVKVGWEVPVVQATIGQLLEDGDIAGLELQPVASRSTTIAHALNLLAICPGVLKTQPGPVCPFLTLPMSVEQFHSTRSRNYRKKIGEFERRCDRTLSARFRVAATSEETSRDLETLTRLHAVRWDGASRAFQSRQYVEFHERFAQLALQRGWLRLYSLESGDATMAMLYCYCYDRRYYFYQSGRDPHFAKHRVGLVLMHKVILEAIREQAKSFDFLSGDEAYKYRWATGTTHGSRIHYWKSAAGWAVSTWRNQIAAISRVPRRFLRLAKA